MFLGEVRTRREQAAINTGGVVTERDPRGEAAAIVAQCRDARQLPCAARRSRRGYRDE
jgi:hypothetical protein